MKKKIYLGEKLFIFTIDNKATHMDSGMSYEYNIFFQIIITFTVNYKSHFYCEK